MGAALRDQVPNPFFGYIRDGVLSQQTVQRGQLLLRFPQYTGFRSIGKVGNSIYHSLQTKAEKRFSSGGRLLAAYTFSKLITDVESNTGWLEGGQNAGLQDPNNLRRSVPWPVGTRATGWLSATCTIYPSAAARCSFRTWEAWPAS
jgi:hypothetical protein